jgi:hypothetical protein
MQPWRFTLTIPACVTVDVTGRVLPAVSGSSTPSAPSMNFSMIALAKMRSPMPVRVMP